MFNLKMKTGKSTLVNYLIGHEIKFENKHDELFAYVNQSDQNDSNEYAKIGQSLDKSETLFPEGFVDKTTNIIYCDCPGFLENRDLEEKIAVAVNLELAIKNSGQVKAIIVAVSYNELYAGRGDSFKSLYKILDNLVKDIEKLGPKIIFVITRCKSELRPESFLSYINELLTSNSSALKDLGMKFINKMRSENKKNEKNIKEKERIVKILNLIKDNPNNIVIGDLKNQKCKDKIVSIEKSSANPIPKSSFCFESYDDNRMLFDEFINQKIYESVKHLRRMVSKPAEIADIENQLDECLSKIEFYNSEIKKIKSIMNGNLIENIEEDARTYQQIYAENQKKLQSVKNKLEENTTKIQLYDMELEELESDKPYLIKDWIFFEKRVKILGAMSKSSKKFKYSNSLTPIFKVEKQCEKGK